MHMGRSKDDVEIDHLVEILFFWIIDKFGRIGLNFKIDFSLEMLGKK